MTRVPKVLHLAPAHVATDTRVFWKECRTLRDAGWAVTLVARHEGDTRLDGVDIIGLGGRGWGSRIRNLARVVRAVAQTRADIVHVHDFEVLPVAIALGVLGRRVIVDFHEDYPLLVQSRSYVPQLLRRPAAGLVSTVERLAVRAAAGVISAEDAGARRFSTKKVSVIRNYVLESELDELRSAGDGCRAQAAVYVGTVNRERGLFEMIEGVGRAGAGLELRLIGDISSELHELVQASAGADRVREYGRCDRARTCAVLASSAVGLILWHPTPKHAGGAVPVKLFEYMAAGLPVIASDLPEIRAVVEPARAGFLVDPLDVDTVASHLRWLVDHPDEARVMGESGRRAVVEQYTWRSQAPTLLALYDEIDPLATAGPAVRS